MIAALAGTSTTNDVTLTGTAQWIAGSTDETGTATYKAVANANRLDLSLSGGTRSEIRNNTANIPAGSWIGADGVSHAISQHNLFTDPGWFPLFALANINSSANTVLAYIGPETRDGVTVLHISAAQQTATSDVLLQHLSQIDLYLDPSTFLPVAITYKTHPDNNALVDIPIEIRYSSYRTFNGAQIPMRVQQFVNSVLALDLQFQNVNLNTGLTGTQISSN